MSEIAQSILFRVQADDLQRLNEALGIPYPEVYVDLAPGAKLTESGTPLETRDAGSVPPWFGFLLDVTSQVTAAGVVGVLTSLLHKFRQGGAQNITIVNIYNVNLAGPSGKADDEVTAEQAEKIQRLLKFMEELNN